MMEAIDRLDLGEAYCDEPIAEEEYRALVRSLRRKKGFGLFFVQTSPAKGQEILADLRRDLPGKQVAEVTIGRTDDRLFEQLELVWEKRKVDIFWIEGLDQSLLGYEDVQRLAGWDAQDLMTYSWKDVPPILAHLNLGRERFEERFDCAVVFVVPLFVVKYLLRRAGDFFDWRSGFFEFSEDQQESVNQVIEDGNYNAYLKLDRSERTRKILQIRDLLDVSGIGNDRRASLLRELGRLFESGKEYEQAVTSYEHAVQIKPNFRRAWNNKGNALRKLGRYEQSIETYQHVIQLDPKIAVTFQKLGGIYFAQKNYEQSILAYKRSIELNWGLYIPEKFSNAFLKNSLNFLVRIIEFNIYSLLLPISKTLFECKIGSLIPMLNGGNAFGLKRQSSAYYLLGNAYGAQRNYGQAILAFKCAMALNPRDTNAYNNLGMAYFAQKEYEQAVVVYQQAIGLNPQEAMVYSNLGNIYYAQKNYEQAIMAYEQAIELNPNLKQAYANRGEVYRSTKRYEEALKDFDRAIEIDPEYLWANLCRSGIYLFLHQPEKVIASDIPEAYEGNWLFYTRGLAYLKLDRIELAQSEFQQAITIATFQYEKVSTDHQNIFNLALYHLAAAYPEESDRLYTSALTAPKEWLQMAIDDLDDFLDLFPDNHLAQQAKQKLQGAILETMPSTPAN